MEKVQTDLLHAQEALKELASRIPEDARKTDEPKRLNSQASELSLIA